MLDQQPKTNQVKQQPGWPDSNTHTRARTPVLPRCVLRNKKKNKKTPPKLELRAEIERAEKVCVCVTDRE